jgi:hypothetical protein
VTKPLYEPLRDISDVPITCAHKGCVRYAVRVTRGARKHVEFKRNAHNCCSHHSKDHPDDFVRSRLR